MKREFTDDRVRYIVKHYKRNAPELAKKYNVNVSTIFYWLRKAGIKTVEDKTLEERFHGRIKKTSGCWLWTGTRMNKGYGTLAYKGKEYLAHRIAYRIYHGKEPSDLVCHHCDNPPCVRPDHLFLGTYSDNFRDAVAKGRIVGEGAHNVKLKQREIDEIRELYNTRRYPQSVLAKRFKTTQGHISRIINYKEWPKHAHNNISMK